MDLALLGIAFLITSRRRMHSAFGSKTVTEHKSNSTFSLQYWTNTCNCNVSNNMQTHYLVSIYHGQHKRAPGTWSYYVRFSKRSTPNGQWIYVIAHWWFTWNCPLFQGQQQGMNLMHAWRIQISVGMIDYTINQYTCVYFW